jgi:hypothetical protein
MNVVALRPKEKTTRYTVDDLRFFEEEIAPIRGREDQEPDPFGGR